MIYETRGRAREYFELAANLYQGCEHACKYCYGADVLHKKPGDYFRRGVPRPNAVAILKADADQLAKKKEQRHVLLSFVTDPYQPVEMELKLTRQAIEALHMYGIYVAILTKGGLRATRDFDILTPEDTFGVSLTTLNRETWVEWEPNTPPASERIRSLEMAKKAGIPTWVSCEPVLVPGETLQLIRLAAESTDVFKVGTLNYRKEAERVHWKKFAEEVVALLDSLGANYYIKKDLARHIGHPEGITVGKVPK